MNKLLIAFIVVLAIVSTTEAKNPLDTALQGQLEAPVVAWAMADIIQETMRCGEAPWAAQILALEPPPLGPPLQAQVRAIREVTIRVV